MHQIGLSRLRPARICAIGLRKSLNRSQKSTLFVDVLGGARHGHTVPMSSEIGQFHGQTGWIGNVIGILSCNEFCLAQA
jgi:hypothetical protein